MNLKMNNAKETSHVHEPIIDDSLQSPMSATNVEIHSVAERRSMATSEELSAFISRAKVEAIRRRETEKAYVCTFSLDSKPPYPMKIATKAYLVGYTVKGRKEYGRACSVIPRFYENPQQ